MAKATSRARPQGVVRLTPRYSGRNSHGFWRRVNALKGKDWDAAYSMGVALQNHEQTVLRFINDKKSNTSRDARREMEET
jgi:fructose-bisphosphate aldolase class 1